MEKRIQAPTRLEGEVTPPGDKSISHRAVMFNSLAQGVAHIINFLRGEDCFSTIACLRALGTRVELSPSGTEATVWGTGLTEAEEVLDCGNSGTTMRLMAGILAAQPFFSVMTGDGSLRSRPMGRIAEPLRLMGAEVWGRGGGTLAPLAIRGGGLKGIEYKTPVASAQVKSAIILAGLYAQGETAIEEPAPSRDHTERLLRAMGAEVISDGRLVRVRPVQALRAIDVQVPGDISAAAYWLVAGAIHPQAKLRICSVGLNPTRTGVVDVLQEMGARLKVESQRTQGGEPIADLVIESSELKGVEIGGETIPRLIDEILVIAVAAASAEGTTVIRDAAELQNKESNRIATTVRELSKLGARIEETADGMVIQGVRQLRGAECQSYQDHRLAMSLGVAGMVAVGETVIADAEAVAISYPGFWDCYNTLAHQG